MGVEECCEIPLHSWQSSGIVPYKECAVLEMTSSCVMMNRVTQSHIQPKTRMAQSLSGWFPDMETQYNPTHLGLDLHFHHPHEKKALQTLLDLTTD